MALLSCNLRVRQAKHQTAGGQICIYSVLSSVDHGRLSKCFCRCSCKSKSKEQIRDERRPTEKGTSTSHLCSGNRGFLIYGFSKQVSGRAFWFQRCEELFRKPTKTSYRRILHGQGSEGAKSTQTSSRIFGIPPTSRLRLSGRQPGRKKPSERGDVGPIRPDLEERDPK